MLGMGTESYFAFCANVFAIYRRRRASLSERH